jgi:hypothetical protein
VLSFVPALFPRHLTYHKALIAVKGQDSKGTHTHVAEHDRQSNNQKHEKRSQERQERKERQHLPGGFVLALSNALVNQV